jgi:hypothetical protein
MKSSSVWNTPEGELARRNDFSILTDSSNAVDRIIFEGMLAARIRKCNLFV